MLVAAQLLSGCSVGPQYICSFDTGCGSTFVWL
jgi:hypothetical protein